MRRNRIWYVGLGWRLYCACVDVDEARGRVLDSVLHEVGEDLRGWGTAKLVWWGLDAYKINNGTITDSNGLEVE